MKPQSIETTASLTLEMLPGGPTITGIHLDVTARVPGAEQGKFDTAVETARKNCPISRLLNTKITASAKLVS